jgi:hypothetical protein
VIKIKEILNPINALALGNSFKDEYSFYKYKQEDFTNIKTEKENLLILIMSYRFNLIDMSYLLDINPDNLELLNHFNKVKKDFYNLLSYYEDKYNALSNIAFKDFDKYCYLAKPWVGDK